MGSVSPRVGAAALTGFLDPDVPVDGHLGHWVLHDASVFAHLLPGQTREADACLWAQEEAVVDPAVLGAWEGGGGAVHLHLRADLGGQDVT